MKIALIYNSTRADTTGNYFGRALAQIGLPSDRFQLSQLKAIAPEYDLYLRIDHGDDYAVDWPAALRPRAFYTIDTHLAHTWKKIRRVVGAYDVLYCCHRKAADAIPGAVWTPLACDAHIHAPVETAAVWDLAFIGNDGGIPRKFYLQALRERYPQSFIGTAAYTDMGRLYSQARVGFNYSIGDDVNMRIFEVLAAKTCLVTNALSHTDLEDLGLRDGKELVLYRSPCGLFDILDTLIHEPREAQRIAEAGHAAAVALHTYAHRVQAMLAVCAKRGLLSAKALPKATLSASTGAAALAT